MTRGAYGRWGGLTEDRIKHPVKTERAPALVAPDCILGVPDARIIRARFRNSMRRRPKRPSVS